MAHIFLTSDAINISDATYHTPLPLKLRVLSKSTAEILKHTHGNLNAALGSKVSSIAVGVSGRNPTKSICKEIPFYPCRRA